MADESFDAKPAEVVRPSSRGRPLLRGCAGLAALVLLVFAVASMRASSSLDQRFTTLTEQLAAVKARPKERPVLFGAPVDGNSVDHLRAAEWILAEADERTAHPSMVTPAMERGHPKAHSTDLTKLLNDARDSLRKGEPLAPAAAEATRTYAPVIQHVRDGLRRGRCDWETRIEDGAAIELPRLTSMREAALLMAYAAELEPDSRAAARGALEIVAYGQDMARQGTLIAVMIGVAIKAVGLESLERTLRRRGLPREGYEEVIAGLDAVGSTDFAVGLETDRLGMQVEISKLSGRRLGDAKETPPEAVPGGVWLLRKVGPLFFEQEWSVFVDQYTRSEQLVSAPRGSSGPSTEALQAEIESSWTIFTKMAMPNLWKYRDRFDESLAVVHALRVLAAAHLHRLESGAFPADAQPLAARLGGALPADPFRPGGEPLSYALAEGEVRVWSVGVDATDDGGDGRWFDAEEARKDLVVVGGAPTD